MKYVQSEVMYERIENQGFIIKCIEGIPYLEGVIALDEIGVEIWEYLSEARDIAEVIEYICSIYDANPLEIEQDISDYLQSMLKEQIIHEVK